MKENRDRLMNSQRRAAAGGDLLRRRVFKTSNQSSTAANKNTLTRMRDNSDSDVLAY